MVSLLLLMRRRPCHCQAGVIVLVTMALLPLIRNGIVALLQWHYCHPQAGIIALVAMALLSSLMRRHPCCYCDGVVALVVMALLQLKWRGLCHNCNGFCCPHSNGVSVVVELA